MCGVKKCHNLKTVKINIRYLLDLFANREQINYVHLKFTLILKGQ